MSSLITGGGEMFLDRGRRELDTLCGEGRGDAAERALATRGSGIGAAGEDVLAIRLLEGWPLLGEVVAISSATMMGCSELLGFSRGSCRESGESVHEMAR